MKKKSPVNPVCLSTFGRVCAVALTALACVAAEAPLVTLQTRFATFGIDGHGALCGLSRNSDGRGYLAPNQPSPLLSVRVRNALVAPEKAAWDAAGKRLNLSFAGDLRVALSAAAKSTHIVFEVLEVQSTNEVELVLWGPYPTRIGEIVGEVVGVVRDSDFAIGIQALNAKTLGGYPARENDIEADYTGEDPGNYAHLPRELNKEQLFRGDTARGTGFGSVLQAFCRNRSQNRVIANWGHEKYFAPAYRDGGVIGSRIALFACPATQALETIGAIEIAEGLPHPMLDGQWVKVATNANCSYLIVDFSEETIDRAIEMTRRAGLNYLYHSSPFETWGHFELKRSLFPNGWDGLRSCVEKARKAGVRIGIHTLSNFITPNDPYVTPKPDRRLARIGTSTLNEAVSTEQKEIAVASLEIFQKKTAMNAVLVGEELIRYGAVSTEAPWRLLDCQRGAWGTRAAAHAAGESVAKLMDHDYKVFLTDPELTQEVAGNLAKLCNHAGTLQISLDGLEGNWSTGMGQYGRTLFTTAWYEALRPELRGQINDASNPGHFNWHIYTRMNWGEPWYAGFRESQTLYRFKNQLHFERNLMPHMLGWFALRPDTSIEDAEWLLARAAGFDAGFALATSLASAAQLAADPSSADAAKRFGATLMILEAMKQWETARLAGAFPPDVKALLRDNAREFHLEPAGEGRWNLYAAHTERFTHDASRKEVSTLSCNNPHAAQPLQWVARCEGKQPVSAVSIAINGKSVLGAGEIVVPPGGSLKYTGGPEARVYDSSWKELGRVPVMAAAARVERGEQKVGVGCKSQAGSSLKIEVRTLGTPTPVAAGAGKRLRERVQESPRFKDQLITKAVKFGYQLVAADFNGDGRKDLLAVDEAATEVAWFENPTWDRHVLATNVPRPLNAACCDLDGDKIPELILAYRFESRPEQSVGNVALFTHGKNVRQPWAAREIDRVPTAHRVRFMDPEGNGRKVLLLGPMVGQRFPPVEGDPAPIYLYRPGQWQRETISTEPRGVLHAINPVRWDGTEREQLLAASFAGLHRLEFLKEKWVATMIAPGDMRPWPLCGSSEVRLGHVGPERILVAIEPWHGNQVVVYLPQNEHWNRIVLEDGMENGHALAVGDLDGDGRDEIVCGFRGKGCQLSLYQAQDSGGERWRKTVLDDGGIAGADCVIEDFSGDGRPDIACIGASTGNVKLYINQGK